MIGDHTIKSQRPRSVHEKRVTQEQADAAKFMAQTGNTLVTFLYLLLSILAKPLHASIILCIFVSFFLS